MHVKLQVSIERLMRIGFAVTVFVLLLVGGIALAYAQSAIAVMIIAASIALLPTFLALLHIRIRRSLSGHFAANNVLYKKHAPLLKARLLQDAIFNSSNFSCIVTDSQGVIQFFNVGAERALGYTSFEVVNKLTPVSISDHQEIVDRATALSREWDTVITPDFETLVCKASRDTEDIYELTYIRKDGSRFPAIVSVTALFDKHKNAIGFLFIGTDNTVCKQVEAEQATLYRNLLDNQLYTRSLIESHIDAIVAINLNGIISDVNQQMQKLTGCDREELIGALFTDYFTDKDLAEDAFMRTLQEDKVINHELIVRARNGKETVVLFNAATIHDGDRKLQGVLATVTDVTDRKQFEQLLLESNLALKQAKVVAEKANLAKSEFLSSMSHELRTPLNAVLGFAQLMASETPPPSPKQMKSIDQILRAGWYLLRLINEILDLATIESGKVTVLKETISLTEELQSCRAMVEPQASQRGIHITFNPPDIPCYVTADRTRVKQVIINLLTNAIKYNRPGGSIVVQCVMSSKNRVRVDVADTGIGLSPKQMEQLFQPFNRLGQESGSEEGSGIGLFVTKQLIELMGGIIGVESKVGVGSVFWFELCLSDTPDTSGEETDDTTIIDAQNHVSGNELPSRTLLYVEDNPANMALVEQLIARRDDLKLLTALDGHEGVRKAIEHKPDVILMDINLPGLNGYSALEILCEDPATAHIPVIALSANALRSEIERGLEAGFFRYLTKPIKVVEFMEALDTALRLVAKKPVASNSENAV